MPARWADVITLLRVSRLVAAELDMDGEPNPGAVVTVIRENMADATVEGILSRLDRACW